MALRLSTGLRQALLGTADFRTEFTGCFINIYTGAQPASADDAATGTLLAKLYSNYPTNTLGLSFDAPVLGVISKAAAETWSNAAAASGTAGCSASMKHLVIRLLSAQLNHALMVRLLPVALRSICRAQLLPQPPFRH